MLKGLGVGRLRFYSTSGPGGYVAAIRAAQLGLKRTSLGGTCLNVGCIPSKALLHNSHLFHQAKTEFSIRGIDGDVSLNLKNMLAFKDRTVSQLTKGIEFLFKKNKVEWIKGTASFVDSNSITISPSHSIIRAKNFLVATGSESVSLPGALNFENVPRKLLVVGGGIIGLELSSVWSRLGSQVTVVEFLDSIGAGMDSATATQFQKMLAKQGISFKLSTRVLGAKKSDSGWQVSVKKDDKEETLDGDVILVSVGRRAYTEGLGLSKIGVKMDSKGRIETDSNFKTSVANIYAIGDVIVGPMLAHKAEEEGIAAVDRLAGKGGSDHEIVIPSVIYTHPEVAWAGKTEEEMKGSKYVSSTFPFMANSRAKTNGDFEGMIKLLVSEDRLCGIHIIGPNAGEMIGEAVLAMQAGIPVSTIASTCHAHPTLSEALKEICMSVSAPTHKPIHF